MTRYLTVEDSPLLAAGIFNTRFDLKRKAASGVNGLDKKRIWGLLSRSPERMTAADLERCLAVRDPRQRNAVRRAVRELVDEGLVQYTYRLGCSFLEPSVQGIRRVADRIVLRPPERPYRPQPGETVVILASGSAFGMGDHASTRLALQGVEKAMGALARGKGRGKGRMLDMGTGCGVLMIAGVLLGMETALGIDPDPCARYEARENARLNGIGDRVEVTSLPVETLQGSFALVTANLRWPTLKDAAPRLRFLTAQGGALVASGLRRQEMSPFLDSYGRPPFSGIWTACDQDWCGALLMRKGNVNE